MSPGAEYLRAAVWTVLKRTRLLPLVFWCHNVLLRMTNPNVRHLIRLRRKRMQSFNENCASVLRHISIGDGCTEKRCLVLNFGVPSIEFDLLLIKALETAGVRTDLLVADTRTEALTKEYCQFMGVADVHFHRNFVKSTDVRQAISMLNRCRTVNDVIALKHVGVRVGRYAVSTAMRWHYLGNLDLEDRQIRRIVLRSLVASMSFAEAAHRILDRLRPEFAIFHDCAYTPEGELFDACLKRKVNSISWFYAHRSNALMLKRYTWDSRRQHPGSLSPESWELARRILWTPEHQAQLDQEIYGSYTRGNWQGTQYGKRLVQPQELRTQLGLDPAKKTACIFPHILWDAPYSWGEGLFPSYEAWLIETVRAACANTNVNWLIKIHPINILKNISERRTVEPSEVIAIRTHLGDLPPHISIIPAESPISTYSLLAVMDSCVTVCGTVGIEAARLGIPVLTASTGRYDRKGFTLDSDSAEEYLARIAHIHELPRLTSEQQELANKFAFGSLILRALPLSTISLDYDATLMMAQVQLHPNNIHEWRDASDLQAFADWFLKSKQTDFLISQ